MDHLPQSRYVEDARWDVAPFIPTAARTVLDVGCGDGGFGRTLRSVLGDQATIVGVEAVDASAETARVDHGYDAVHHGFFPDALPRGCGPFDLVVFNDVLEHILEPDAALRAARAWLGPDGRVLASIPNVQHLSVLQALARGRWEYQEHGILDKTHVRFFTRSSMIELFDSAGLHVERCVGINGYERRFASDPIAPRRALKLAVARQLRDLNFEQYVIVARTEATPTVEVSRR